MAYVSFRPLVENRPTVLLGKTLLFCIPPDKMLLAGNHPRFKLLARAVAEPLSWLGGHRRTLPNRLWALASRISTFVSRTIETAVGPVFVGPRRNQDSDSWPCGDPRPAWDWANQTLASQPANTRMTGRNHTRVISFLTEYYIPAPSSCGTGSLAFAPSSRSLHGKKKGMCTSWFSPDASKHSVNGH